MPTKVFTILDATLFSEITNGNLGLGTPSPDPPAEIYPYTDFITLIGSGTIDFNVNYNPVNPLITQVVRNYLNDGIVLQQIDIDYTKVLTGLSAGSRIKKMVINSPYSVNASANSSSPIVSPQRLSFYVGLQITVNAITDLNDVTNTVFTPNTEVLLAETVTGAAADFVVFDLTAGATYIDLADFIVDYERITKDFTLSTLCEANGALDFNCHVVLEQGWTITVTYEASPIQFELNPQVKNEENPEDTVYYITDGINNDTGVAIPLNTVTSLLAYYSGGVVNIPFTLTNDPPNPLDPDGNWIYFTLPAAIPANEDVIIVVTGTQFSGEVEVQTIYAILVNGSGIYTLVPGQKHDVYYNRAVDPVETVNLAIPTPKFKTGYFGG